MRTIPDAMNDNNSSTSISVIAPSDKPLYDSNATPKTYRPKAHLFSSFFFIFSSCTSHPAMMQTSPICVIITNQTFREYKKVFQ